MAFKNTFNITQTKDDSLLQYLYCVKNVAY